MLLWVKDKIYVTTPNTAFYNFKDIANYNLKISPFVNISYIKINVCVFFLWCTRDTHIINSSLCKCHASVILRTYWQHHRRRTDCISNYLFEINNEKEQSVNKYIYYFVVIISSTNNCKWLHKISKASLFTTVIGVKLYLKLILFSSLFYS